MDAYDEALDEYAKETNPLKGKDRARRSRPKGPLKKFPSSDEHKLLKRASDVLQLDNDTYNPEENDSKHTIAAGTEGKGLESLVEQSMREIEITSPRSDD